MENQIANMHIYRYVYICIYVHMHTCTYVYVYTCIYVHMCVISLPNPAPQVNNSPEIVKSYSILEMFLLGAGW